MSGLPTGEAAEVDELREQVARLLRVEDDLFRRNAQLEGLWKTYRALSALGKHFQARLTEPDIAAAVVHFVLYALNIERGVVALRHETRVRVIASDGYFDAAQARAIAGLGFAHGHPLFEPVGAGERHRLRASVSLGVAVPAGAGTVRDGGERDVIAQTFDLAEYVCLPLREHAAGESVGFVLAGNSAEHTHHHNRIVADDGVVLALENLVDLTSAALRGLRLDRALQAERDLLEARVEERTREREQLLSEIIRVQEQRLEELSTPILPIADHVLVMPLIGTMDSHRAEALQLAALDGAAKRRAKFVILDVTGVISADTTFSHALLRTAASLRLLGVQVVVTGIRPDVARTLVEIGADIDDVVTHATLQSGIAYAIGHAHRGS
jgi:anti-anti-sigma regulatory factor